MPKQKAPKPPKPPLVAVDADGNLNNDALLKASDLERQFAAIYAAPLYRLPELHYPPLLAEFRFMPPRLSRFDFAIVPHQIAIEIEGGTYIRGRHNRGAAYWNDCQKYNAAALGGWLLLRYTVDAFRLDPSEVIMRDVNQALRLRQMP